MNAFTDKITHFRWVELDGRHGTLHVWEDQDEAARLVLFTEAETGNTYVLVDETIDPSADSDELMASMPGA